MHIMDHGMATCVTARAQACALTLTCPKRAHTQNEEFFKEYKDYC